MSFVRTYLPGVVYGFGLVAIVLTGVLGKSDIAHVPTMALVGVTAGLLNLLVVHWPSRSRRQFILTARYFIATAVGACLAFALFAGSTWSVRESATYAGEVLIAAMGIPVLAELLVRVLGKARLAH
jgi:membrane associated rhomboid family serine protease